MSRAQPESVRLLTPNDLADRWCCSRSKVYELVRRRQVPFLYIGGSVRFRPQDIERFEEAKAQEHSPWLTTL